MALNCLWRKASPLQSHCAEVSNSKVVTLERGLLPACYFGQPLPFDLCRGQLRPPPAIVLAMTALFRTLNTRESWVVSLHQLINGHHHGLLLHDLDHRKKLPPRA